MDRLIVFSLKWQKIRAQGLQMSGSVSLLYNTETTHIILSDYIIYIYIREAANSNFGAFWLKNVKSDFSY